MEILGALIAGAVILVFALAFGAFVWAILKYARQQQEEYRRRLRAFAGEAGLEYVPDVGPWYSRKAAHVIGEYRDRHVKLDSYTVSHGKSSTTYQRMEAGPVDLRGRELRVGSENFFTKVFQAVGGADVRIGDPVFDGKFFIRASAAGFAREVLAEGELREKLAATIEESRGGVVAEKNQIRWTAVGTSRSPQLLLVILDTLCDLADAAENC